MADAGVTLDIVVAPRASRARLGPMRDGRLRVAVTAPPVDGEANAAVIEVLADRLGVPKRAIAIAHGATGKRKTVRIAGLTRAALDAFLATVLLVGCSGTQGTLAVDLKTAPGSTVMDAVTTLDIALTNPDVAYTAERASDGSFALDLALDASDTARAIAIDGKDAGGAIVAVGAAPPLPVNAIDGHVVIYMAAPFSIGAALAPLSVARSESGIGALTYGAVIVGGRSAAGASDAVDIYNVYDHSVVSALALPAALIGPAVGVTAANNVLIFGGTGGDGATSGALHQLQTAVAPSGAYIDLGDHPEVARTGQRALLTAADQFTVSGDPPIELSSLAIAARTDAAAVLPVGASVTAADGTVTAMFANATTGLTRIRNEIVDTPTGDPTVSAQAACARPGAAIVFAGGARAGAPIDDVVALDPATAQPAVAHLATPRSAAACAATARFLVVAGGLGAGGALVGDAEILDAVTLAPVVAPQPLGTPRAHATAIALANGQIAIVGGTDATGAPVATIELFTPPN